jgi:hypothetical protein
MDCARFMSFEGCVPPEFVAVERGDATLARASVRCRISESMRGRPHRSTAGPKEVLLVVERQSGDGWLSAMGREPSRRKRNARHLLSMLASAHRDRARDLLGHGSSRDWRTDLIPIPVHDGWLQCCHRSEVSARGSRRVAREHYSRYPR